MTAGREIRVSFPSYPARGGNRNAWRIPIHDAMCSAFDEAALEIAPRDRIEIELVLGMTESQLRFHDVDNRLKDVMDALQGRLGGPKAARRYRRLVPNDHQVFRVVVEKRLADQDPSMSSIVLRALRH